MQIGRDLGEAVLFGLQTGDDLVSDLPHRRLVEGEQPRRDLFLDGRATLLTGPQQLDVAADVLSQQPLRVEQVELVVLLEHASRDGSVSERKCTLAGFTDAAMSRSGADRCPPAA